MLDWNLDVAYTHVRDAMRAARALAALQGGEPVYCYWPHERGRDADFHEVLGVQELTVGGGGYQMTCLVRVVPEPDGWRIVVCVGRYRFEGTIFARERDAAKAAAKIAQEIGAEYEERRRRL
jgi:hypothetical protein